MAQTPAAMSPAAPVEEPDSTGMSLFSGAPVTRDRARKLLFLVLLAGAFFRLWGLRWDEGRHLHPDERFISMVEERVRWPGSPAAYFDSAHSRLNPYNNEFGSYVYGTVPLVVAKAAGQLVGLKGYDGTYLVGRVSSALFDLLSVWLTYLIVRRLAGRGTALTAAALVSFCPLGIQLSHFWGSECFLTAFSAAALLGAVRISQGKSRIGGDLATGVALGLATACKVTALALLAPIGVAILVRRLQSGGTPRRAPGLAARLALVAGEFLVTCAAGAAAVRIALPYAFAGPSPLSFRLDPRYVHDIQNLVNITKSFAGFPPMLQWAGQTPLFPLRNLVLWGAGPFFGLAALAAFVWAPIEAFRRKAFVLLPLWVHVAAVFGYHAMSPTMNIRYFYPAYPALAALAALLVAAIASRVGQRSGGSRLARLLPAAIVVGTFLCGLAFSSIYRHAITRCEASRWIYDNVPPPARFLNEDWDDGLPFATPDHDLAAYSGPPLNLYGPDNAPKADTIVAALEKADWIAITSNRAYGSITRLPDVYPMSTAFYRALFDGRLGFERMANFASYPRIGPLQVPDDTAEETFTVYDHPRVLLFRKEKGLFRDPRQADARRGASRRFGTMDSGNRGRGRASGSALRSSRPGRRVAARAAPASESSRSPRSAPRSSSTWRSWSSACSRSRSRMRSSRGSRTAARASRGSSG